MSDYSVLIHTCDKYKPCWEPFFKCFSKFWTNPYVPIYFANEECDVDLPADIQQIKTGYGAWSDRLLTALDMLPDKPIFYMLEDFWLTREVDIDKYFDLFKEIDADSLRVVYKSPLLILDLKNDNLYHIDSRSRYILSCQPSFWIKDYLRSTLVKGEDPWQFEVDGTSRMHKKGYRSRACLVDEDWYVGAYTRGKINKEGEKYLKEIKESKWQS